MSDVTTTPQFTAVLGNLCAAAANPMLDAIYELRIPRHYELSLTIVNAQRSIEHKDPLFQVWFINDMNSLEVNVSNVLCRH